MRQITFKQRPSKHVHANASCLSDRWMIEIFNEIEQSFGVELNTSHRMALCAADLKSVLLKKLDLEVVREAGVIRINAGGQAVARAKIYGVRNAA